MARVDSELLSLVQRRYRRASREERSAMLDEFVKTTGYHRKHAIRVLGAIPRADREPIRRPREAVYGEPEAQALLELMELFDSICSRRLRAAMDVELPRLYFEGKVRMRPDCYDKLMAISPATIDRLLKSRRVQLVKSRGHTKPGTLLKHQIPVRTWAEWTEDQPGFCEMDLVDHSGGRVIRGVDHAWTLCFTDVHTAWTECVAVRNKAQIHVFAAIQRARERLPFALLGIDSDNGSEFINHQLIRYCKDEKITMTRARVGRKNDNAYVEQKNWSIVRRVVGYNRYDTPEQLGLLQRLYATVHYYANFFLPVAKLQCKTRDGSRVKRTYDAPQTPYARVLASDRVPDERKTLLRDTYSLIDLVDLRRQVTDLQDVLFHSASAL